MTTNLIYFYLLKLFSSATVSQEQLGWQTHFLTFMGNLSSVNLDRTASRCLRWVFQSHKKNPILSIYPF